MHATTCASCGRAVFTRDVDAQGRCCLCAPAPRRGTPAVRAETDPVLLDLQGQPED